MESLYRNLPKLLVPWYRQHARQLPWRRDRKPYHVWISEIMLQQTRVEAVKGYYARFLKALPAVEQLAAAEEGILLKLWEGLGYYNRVRNMQKTARIIVDTYHGRFPQTAGELERLPGIGPYTAGAIASICFEQPAAAVDGNVLRVVARVCNIQSPVDLPQVKKEITSCLQRVYPAQNRGDFTQSMMELGATVCLPDRQPRCKACPLGGICRARQLGLPSGFATPYAEEKTPG